jgi:L,D-peptidoglycan transpeptidase YkuD (ErfK/YbiS/YcfS/YnhG family)
MRETMMLTRRAVVAGSAGLLSGAEAALGTRYRSDVIKVSAAPGASQGTLAFVGREYACVLGRSGIVHPKKEGDGGTPAGVFLLREVRYRADRQTQPKTGLRTVPTSKSDGWCDDPSDAAYNRLVTMPYRTSAEALWRDDHAYDVLAVIGYNDTPTVPGAGSAIFLHVMRTDAGGAQLPTVGCVALKLEDLLAVLAACQPQTLIAIRTVPP